MKTNRPIAGWLTLLALSILNLQPSTVFAQTTAITYQGRLNDGANPANGNYDLRFTVYDAGTNGDIVVGPITNAAVAVSNGLFTTLMDFGVGPSSSQAIWLDIAVRTNGATTFTALTPRTLITPVPLAYFANTAGNLTGTLPASQLCGTLPATVLAGCSGPVTLTNGGNSFNGTFSGSFSGSGASLTGVPGTFTWQNVTGTSQQAQPNTGYLANNASQVTITLPTSPNLGDIVRVSGVGAGGWIIAQNAGQAIQASQFGAIATTNWNSLTNWTQTSAPSAVWTSIASSADGTKLAAGVWGGGIYTSTNSGQTWVQSSVRPAPWSCIASSDDGTRLAAVIDGTTGIFISTNSGITWTQTTAAQSQYLVSVASSADGSKLVAADQAGGIYTSTNSGITWNQTSAPAGEWDSIVSSADGTKLAAADWDYGGGIYTSPNSGLTWNQTTAPFFMGCIACSADGTQLAGAESGGGGGISISTNSGISWTQTSAPFGPYWKSIACSADGTKLAVVALTDFGVPGGIYVSTDSGVTWVLSSAPAPTATWFPGTVASSRDGRKLVAAINGGGIWTAQATIQTTTTPGTAGYLTGGQNSAIELQYIGNGQFMPLSYVGPISSY